MATLVSAEDAVSVPLDQSLLHAATATTAIVPSNSYTHLVQAAQAPTAKHAPISQIPSTSATTVASAP